MGGNKLRKLPDFSKHHLLSEKMNMTISQFEKNDVSSKYNSQLESIINKKNGERYRNLKEKISRFGSTAREKSI